MIIRYKNNIGEILQIDLSNVSLFEKANFFKHTLNYDYIILDNDNDEQNDTLRLQILLNEFN